MRDHESGPVLRPAGTPQAPISLSGQSTWRIGRGPTNEIVLEGDLISRHHAVIQRMDDGSFLLLDLGSRNGIFVNGRRITVPEHLNHLDQLRIGEHEFTFLHPEASVRVAISEPGRSEGSEDSEEATALERTTRTVTVLVADLKDFTGLSQRLDQSILAQTVSTWTRSSGPILRKHGCYAEKYIGDSVMAVWLHSTEDQDSTVIGNALRTLAQLAEVARGLQAECNLPEIIGIAAGINTGAAVIGNMGSHESADHTALGDGVNRAFRLEAAAKRLGVDLLVGEDTFDRVQAIGSIRTRFQEHAVEMKGYADPVRAFALPFTALSEVVSQLEAASSG